MIKRQRVRGIHDIVTTAPKPKKSSGSGIGGPGSVRFGSANMSSNKGDISSPRTWVFSTRPKFVRQQKTVEKSLLVEKVEEPAVDVVDKAREVVVLAEMQGAKIESIICKVKDDILIISADATDSRGEKKYEKEVLLPFIANPDSLKTSYENQILEIKLSKMNKTGKRNTGEIK